MTPNELTALFFVAGVIGSGCRAALTTSQGFWTRKSFVDLVIGGLTGILYPLYPLIPLAGNPYQQAAMVAVLSYFAGDALQNLITNRVPKVQSFLGPQP